VSIGSRKGNVGTCLLPATNIRWRHLNLLVETARANESRIKNVRKVSCSQHYHSGVILETERRISALLHYGEVQKKPSTHPFR